MSLKAADWAVVYGIARANPAFDAEMRTALSAMAPGGTYTVTTFKNLRHRVVTGEMLGEIDDGVVALTGGKASIEDIVRITCPKEQLEF